MQGGRASVDGQAGFPAEGWVCQHVYGGCRTRMPLYLGDLDRGRRFAAASACAGEEPPMAYEYDDQNIFARILRGEIPNRTVARDRAHARLPRHPAAGAGACAGDPEGRYVTYDHFAAEASDAEIVDFTRVVGTALRRARRRARQRRRLPADRQRRAGRRAGGAAHARPHPRRTRPRPDAPSRLDAGRSRVYLAESLNNDSVKKHVPGSASPPLSPRSPTRPAGRSSHGCRRARRPWASWRRRSR